MINEAMPLKEGTHVDEAEVRKRTNGWTIPELQNIDPKKVKPIKPAAPIPLESLPPEKQAEIKSALSELTKEQEAYVQGQLNATEAPPLPPTATEPAVSGPMSEAKAPNLCCNCGWNQEIEPQTANAQDKEEFIRSALTNSPFEHTYDLMGGKASVTFRARRFEETQLIQEQLFREINNGKISGNDAGTASARYYARQRELQLTCSLVKFSPKNPSALPPVTAEAYPPLTKDGEVVENEVAVAHRKLFTGWSEPMYAAVYRAGTVFEKLLYNLVEAANSENFWTDPTKAA